MRSLAHIGCRARLAVDRHRAQGDVPRPQEGEQGVRDAVAADDRLPRSPRDPARVGPPGDLRVEHLEQCLQVALVRRADEPFDDQPQLDPVHLEPRRAHLRLHAPARPAGELPARRRRPPDDGADRLEGETEHVVQHERRALGGAQLLQHDQQRHADAVVQRHPVGRVGVVAGNLEQGLREPRADVGLVARPRRPQLVQTQAGDDDDEPAADVVELAEVLAHQSRERLLDDVLGVRQAAQHPVGHVQQQPAVLLPDEDEFSVVRDGDGSGVGFSFMSVAPEDRSLPL